jgi:hypothetical protein
MGNGIYIINKRKVNDESKPWKRRESVNQNKDAIQKDNN